MTTQDIERRYGKVVLECASKSEPSKKPYQVRLLDGVFSCNCMGFATCRTPDAIGHKRCKHTDAARGLVANDNLQVGQALDEILAIFWRFKDQITEASKLAVQSVLERISAQKPESTQVEPEEKPIRRIYFD